MGTLRHDKGTPHARSLPFLLPPAAAGPDGACRQPVNGHREQLHYPRGELTVRSIEMDAGRCSTARREPQNLGGIDRRCGIKQFLGDRQRPLEVAHPGIARGAQHHTESDALPNLRWGTRAQWIAINRIASVHALTHERLSELAASARPTRGTTRAERTNRTQVIADDPSSPDPGALPPGVVKRPTVERAEDSRAQRFCEFADIYPGSLR
jgi:hypothetical protein